MNKLSNPIEKSKITKEQTTKNLIRFRSLSSILMSAMIWEEETEKLVLSK